MPGTITALQRTNPILPILPASAAQLVYSGVAQGQNVGHAKCNCEESAAQGCMVPWGESTQFLTEEFGFESRPRYQLVQATAEEGGVRA